MFDEVREIAEAITDERVLNDFADGLRNALLECKTEDVLTVTLDYVERAIESAQGERETGPWYIR